jgi:hydroxymethylglutaryl-CoA reductase
MAYRQVFCSEFGNGFSKLTREQRAQRLIDHEYLAVSELTLLSRASGLSLDLAEQFIENLIGTYPLPLGIAVNFVIDGKEYVIPMAIEETSVIAAASKNAKWVATEGRITTKTLSKLSTGQIVLPSVKDLELITSKLYEHKQELIDQANKTVAINMVARGGGVKDIVIRSIQRADGLHMVVIHMMIDTCDTMGANFINQVCEFLKPTIEKITSQKVGMCILSNLADHKITQAKVMIHNVDPVLGNAIQEGSLFAELDPYRAATQNKGIMNAIDAILLATGNDWRAVEAGVHGYASRSGTYRPISHWTMQERTLHGILEAPIVVGIVGGVTQLHPIAKICLKLLNVAKAEDLARIIAAVGLVQNLAALRALVTEGITRGHMKLHVKNLALSSGATKDELPILKEELMQRLSEKNRITGKDAREILNKIRQVTTC